MLRITEILHKAAAAGLRPVLVTSAASALVDAVESVVSKFESSEYQAIGELTVAQADVSTNFLDFPTPSGEGWTLLVIDTPLNSLSIGSVSRVAASLQLQVLDLQTEILLTEASTDRTDADSGLALCLVGVRGAKHARPLAEGSSITFSTPTSAEPDDLLYALNAQNLLIPLIELRTSQQHGELWQQIARLQTLNDALNAEVERLSRHEEKLAHYRSSWAYRIGSRVFSLRRALKKLNRKEA